MTVHQGEAARKALNDMLPWSSDHLDVVNRPLVVTVEPRLRELAESIPHIVWMAARDGSTEYFNRLGTTYTGLPPDSNYGWDWVKLVHPDDAEKARRGWKQAVRDATPFTMEYRIRRADGAYRRHAFRGMPMRGPDSSVSGWIGTATDIEDDAQLDARLHEAERQAAESLTLLETLQSAAPIGFGFVDRDFRLVRLNEALAAFNGAPISNQIGRRVADIVPDLWPQLEPVYRQVLDAGVAVVNIDLTGEVPADPGNPHHWLVSYYPVRLATEIIGVGIVVIDITDRERSDAALAASEERFRLFAERAQDIVYRVRAAPERELEYVSPAAERLTGYSPEEFYADPGLWLNIVHPDDRALVDLDPRGEDLEAPVVVRWMCRDGSTLWTEHRSVPVFDDHGELVAIEGVARDVTASVAAEHRVRVSEARFRELLSSIDLGALMLDKSGKVDFINDHLLRLLQRTADEVVGQDWIEIAIPERERANLRDVFAAAMGAGIGAGPREDGVVIGSGGERRLAWTSVIQRDPNGAVAGIAGIAHDVTEFHRLQAERALLAAAVEQTAEAIIVTDKSANIIFVNPAFERVSGYAREEVLGRNPRFLQAAPPRIGTFEEMWTALRGGRTWRGDLANRRKDGTEYTDSVAITPVLDTDGELHAYMSVQRDVSHVREVEADLLLETRVRALLGTAIAAAASTTTLEAAAAAVCEGLVSLPGIDVAQLVTFLDGDEAMVVAGGGLQALPIAVGQNLPGKHASYIRERAAAGPWGTRDGDGEEFLANGMQKAGMRALAFGPISHGSEIAGVLVVGTRDERFASLVAEKMPPLVSFGASSNTPLVDQLTARRQRDASHRAIAAILEAHAFRPVFQPIVELQSGEPIGYEALTRFTSGERPDITFAKGWSAGLGAELELATLAAAIEAANILPAGRWLDLNVSPRLLDHAEQIRALLAVAGRPIVIEITEHDRIEDYGAVRAAVTRLGRDVRLAVDDAGVGVANFGHIVELRPDFVKIDTSLVRGVNSDQGRQALVIAMRHFARTAGCRLVAEGVETIEEARALEQLGVEFAQGYWFGRPEPAEHWGS